MEKLYKILTRNDTGETNSHQSGITIPTVVAKSGIFPKMSKEVLNPREEITFFDEEKVAWNFQYIYYNDVYFGKPKNKSHNEHRLTCVRQYIKENQIRSGDSIWFGIDDNGVRYIGFKKAEQEIQEKKNVIKLTRNWHYVKI